MFLGITVASGLVIEATAGGAASKKKSDNKIKSSIPADLTQNIVTKW
jgi:hypothetical protein